MSELTREQVESLLVGLIQDKIDGVHVAQLIDAFADLRTKLEQVEEALSSINEAKRVYCRRFCQDSAHDLTCHNLHLLLTVLTPLVPPKEVSTGNHFENSP